MTSNIQDLMVCDRCDGKIKTHVPSLKAERSKPGAVPCLIT